MNIQNIPNHPDVKYRVFVRIPFKSNSSDMPDGIFIFKASREGNYYHVWSAYLVDEDSYERHPLDNDFACEVSVDTLPEVYLCLNSDLSPLTHPASIYECI